MITKQMLIAMTVAAVMSASAAMAQTAAPAAPASSPAAAPAAPNDAAKEKQHEEKFEDRKAKALEKLAKRAAAIQEKQACVQAATDKDSLQKCFPKRGERGEHHGWRREHGDEGHEGGAPASGATSSPAPAATDKK
jgi:hypothetical protein